MVADRGWTSVSFTRRADMIPYFFIIINRLDQNED